MPPTPPDSLTFFAASADLRQWFATHHAAMTEVWVGFYKVGSGTPSITYKELVDQALCFGWIDGLRKSLDDKRWMIRVTPRTATSIWSRVNIARMKELVAIGEVRPPGMTAFEQRDETQTNRYSFENATRTLSPAHEQRFKANRRAWAFFEAQPPGYRKMALWFVTSAVKEETQARRVDRLIDLCARERRLEPMAPRERKEDATKPQAAAPKAIKATSATTKPARTKPARTRPARAKPARAKTVKSKAVESKAVRSKAAPPSARKAPRKAAK